MRTHLIEWVLDELRYSLDMEPRGELGSDVKYAAVSVPPHILPRTLVPPASTCAPPATSPLLTLLFGWVAARQPLI